MKSFSLAIVGATGVVGRKFLDVLSEKDYPITKLVLFASSRSAGHTMTFKGKEYEVLELNEENILKNKVDYALFSAGGTTSLNFDHIFAKEKTVVIDNSSAWRMDTYVPLVVPEVN